MDVDFVDMTFADLRQIIIRRWWLPVVFSVIFGLIGLSILLTQEKYEAAVTLNIATVYEKEVVAQTLFPNVDKQLVDIDPETWSKLDPANANKDYAYFRLLGSINGYIINRFSRTDVQSQIARQIGRSTDNLREQMPFYFMGNNGFGSTTFIFRTENLEQAEKFIPAVQEIFPKIIQEWNEGKEIFAIRPVASEVAPSVIKLQPSVQELVLPFFTGLVAGLSVAILIDLGRKRISVFSEKQTA